MKLFSVSFVQDFVRKVLDPYQRRLDPLLHLAVLAAFLIAAKPYALGLLVRTEHAPPKKGCIQVPVNFCGLNVLFLSPLSLLSLVLLSCGSLSPLSPPPPFT